MEVVPPWKMDSKTFNHVMSTTKPAKYSKPYTVDWGHTRGQGKRSGGMVLGGMSAAVRGKKVYIDLFHDLPEDEAKEIGLCNSWTQKYYLIARGYGWDHGISMVIAYCMEEQDPHAEILAVQERSMDLT